MQPNFLQSRIDHSNDLPHMHQGIIAFGSARKEIGIGGCNTTEEQQVSLPDLLLLPDSP